MVWGEEKEAEVVDGVGLGQSEAAEAMEEVKEGMEGMVSEVVAVAVAVARVMDQKAEARLAGGPVAAVAMGEEAVRTEETGTEY